MSHEPADPVVHYELWVRSARGTASWQATLREIDAAASERRFDTPLDLVRFLARGTAPPSGGLR